MKLEWENWDEEESREAWQELRESLSPTEILYALYGGLLENEIEIQGGFAGHRSHGQAAHGFEFGLKDTPSIEEQTISYERHIPIETFLGIAQNHRDVERDENNSALTKEEMEHVLFRIEFNASS